MVSLQVADLFASAGGEFVSTPKSMRKKLLEIKAYLFDWDGVFNNGSKGAGATSLFSEPDSMGTNLLRFAYYHRHRKQLPYTAIVTAMHNDSALQFAQREHFTAIYMEFKHKKEVFERICQEQQLQPHQVAFVFDDVLDLSVAELCGIRIMIGRKASPLLIEYVRDNKLADYITHHTGGEHGVREASELMLGLTNQYRTACEGRIRFEGPYAEYFALRNAKQTQLITPDKA